MGTSDLYSQLNGSRDDNLACDWHSELEWGIGTSRLWPVGQKHSVQLESEVGARELSYMPESLTCGV